MPNPQSLIPDSATKLLAGNAIKSLLIRVGGVGLSLAAYIMLARVMSENAYGSFIYFVTWVGILSLLAQGGFSASIMRFFHEYSANPAALKAYLRTSFLLPIVLTIGVSGLLFAALVAEMLPATLAHITPYLPLAILAFTLAYIAQAALKADHRIVLSQVFEQIGLPLALLGLALYGLMSGETIALATGTTAYMAVFFIIAAITWTLFTKRSYPCSARPEYRLREWLATSFPMCGSSLVAALMSRMDILLLGFFVSAAEVGEYGVAARVAVLLSFLYAALNNALIPTLSKKFQAGETEAINRLLPKIMRLALALTCVGLAGVALLGGWVLSLFGEEYISAAPLLWLLAVAQTANLYAGPAGSILLVSGHQKAYLYFTVAIALLLAGGLWFAIPAYGLMGAAWVTLAVTLLLNAALLILIRRLTGVRII